MIPTLENRVRMDPNGLPVCVFLHPIDTDRHPDWGPGWRWCVQYGHNPADKSSYLQAGWAPHEREARWHGQQTAIAVTIALYNAGHPVFMHEPSVLHDDPTPEG